LADSEACCRPEHAKPRETGDPTFILSASQRALTLVCWINRRVILGENAATSP
jgi:hypothetical protein